MTLTISPAVAEHIDGPTVIKVVEDANAGRLNGFPDSTWPHPAPPADLVALTGECEHHADFQEFGTGSVWHPDYCPRCRNGRKLVEVRVPCLLCEGKGGYPVGNRERVCGDCDSNGYATLKGTIQVVRVLDIEDTPELPCVQVAHDGTTYDAVYWLPDVEGAETLIDVLPFAKQLTPTHVAALEADLGRPIAPGLFAVVFEAVQP